MKLLIHGNPYAIDKVTVNGTECQPKKVFGRKYYSDIECKSGDEIRLYHDPKRQWVLHSENEDSDLVRIWKNSRMTGTQLPESEQLIFIVPSDVTDDAIFDVISNGGKDDNEGYDNIYAAWSIGWAKQVIENRINAVTL